MNLEYPLDPKFIAYKHIQITKCKQLKVVVIGWSDNEEQYAAIVFNKVKSPDQNLSLKEILIEIESKPSYEEIKFQIQRVTGIYHPKQSLYGFGIVGFHKFLQGYYLTYISEVDTCAKIGSISFVQKIEHKIHTIKNTAVISLFQYQTERKTRKNEQKYFEILSQFKLQNFYFSSTYDLSNSLAKNMIRNSKKIFDFKQYSQQTEFFKSKQRSSGQYEKPFQKQTLKSSDIFCFNYGLIEEFYHSIKNKKFVLPLIHGYCKHINVNLKSTIFNVVVIARRSRHHAGTRYIKRGISSQGYVANFVQIQQIVINHSSSHDSRPVCSSFIQVRGSVPTYWMQRPSMRIPKPAIQIKKDDYMFLATRKHFSDLFSRYGGLVYAINLMKMKQKIPRQSLLSKQYNSAVEFINRLDLKEQNQIHYIQIDMKYHLRLDKKLFVNKMKTIAYFAIQNTGLFMCMNHSTSSNQQFIQLQNGVIRANCVDCLDRTNSFQQLMGQTALAIQLNRLIRKNVNFECLQLPQKILDEYSKLYEQMGDLISIQYGSSLAHKQKIQKTTESRFEFLISITRHVNNNWNDYDRQIQMDVFLGYKPFPDGNQIWQQKPIIQHYPDIQLKKFEQINWYEQSLKRYNRYYYVDCFKKQNNKQDYERNLPHIQRLVKQDLVNKFNVEIVNSLINQRQNIQILKFFMTPQLTHTKQTQKKTAKPKFIQTLKQQREYCYNRLDFIKSSQQTKPIITSQKQIRSDLPHEIRKNFIQKTLKPSATFALQDKANIIKNAQRGIEAESLDQIEKKIVQRYMLGQLITDNQIQEQIQDYMKFFNDQIEIDWPQEQDIQKELKLLQSNMNNKNYINFSEISVLQNMMDLMRIKKKTLIQANTFKSAKTIQQKNEKMKQNKILILEQIMKKNFSHGNVQKIQQI